MTARPMRAMSALQWSRTVVRYDSKCCTEVVPQMYHIKTLNVTAEWLALTFHI
jgi:hypothetical protein